MSEQCGAKCLLKTFHGTRWKSRGLKTMHRKNDSSDSTDPRSYHGRLQTLIADFLERLHPHS